MECKTTKCHKKSQSFTLLFYVPMRWNDAQKHLCPFCFLEQCIWLSFSELKRQCLIGTWSALLNKLLISNIWSHIYNFRSCRGLVWHRLYYGVYYYFYYLTNTVYCIVYCIVFYTPRFMLQPSMSLINRPDIFSTKIFCIVYLSNSSIFITYKKYM